MIKKMRTGADKEKHNEFGKQAHPAVVLYLAEEAD
jgi:hypothetical protein